MNLKANSNIIMSKKITIQKLLFIKYVVFIIAILLIVVGTLIIALIAAKPNEAVSKTYEVLPTPNATVIMPEKETSEDFGHVTMWEADEYIELEQEEFGQEPEIQDYSDNTFIDKLVVIDPGHGGFDGGAIGKYSGVHEDDLNLAVSLKLRTLLENKGYEVVMTREDDGAVGATKQGDMGIRRRIIEQADSEITVSIHMNYYSSGNVSGPQAFYFPESAKGEKLAKLVQEELNSNLNPPKQRKATSERYYILRSGTSPAVLIECGFLSNKNEEYLLRQETYQDKLASAIFIGIDRFMMVN